jgi:hypothetical protein
MTGRWTCGDVLAAGRRPTLRSAARPCPAQPSGAASRTAPRHATPPRIPCQTGRTSGCGKRIRATQRESRNVTHHGSNPPLLVTPHLQNLFKESEGLTMEKTARPFFALTGKLFPINDLSSKKNN